MTEAVPSGPVGVVVVACPAKLPWPVITAQVTVVPVTRLPAVSETRTFKAVGSAVLTVAIAGLPAGMTSILLASAGTRHLPDGSVAWALQVGAAVGQFELSLQGMQSQKHRSR